MRFLRDTYDSGMSAPFSDARVHRLVPFVHVHDVEASLRFYGLLGFVPRHVMRDDRGRAFWASAATDKAPDGNGHAEIMFAQASPDPVPEQQAVPFYMYSAGVTGLRTRLLRQGLHDGGPFCAAPGPNNGRCVVFAVTHPDYMPGGELRVADPDGYCILVGQHS